MNNVYCTLVTESNINMTNFVKVYKMFALFLNIFIGLSFMTRAISG